MNNKKHSFAVLSMAAFAIISFVVTPILISLENSSASAFVVVRHHGFHHGFHRGHCFFVGHDGHRHLVCRGHHFGRF